MLSCLWCDRHQPSDAEAAIAQLAVDHAVHRVHRARLIAAVGFAEPTAANLQLALASHREIGVAIGIVMTRYLITRDAAFELLRTASQHSNRKLVDLAAHVIDTGDVFAFTTAQPATRQGRLRTGPDPKQRPRLKIDCSVRSFQILGSHLVRPPGVPAGCAFRARALVIATARCAENLIRMRAKTRPSSVVIVWVEGCR